ncbi:MAG: hypothetical protein COA43_00845 [Robiginitomaculum sp.]|nr:MAG: hypothetical protein COA43_00845 [Robiginitomaculum sp.]
MFRELPKWPTFVWGLLVLITCVSWMVAHDFNGQINVKIASSMTIVLAFAKTRFICFEFMGLKYAPIWAKLFVNLWVALMTIILIGLYWVSS